MLNPLPLLHASLFHCSAGEDISRIRLEIRDLLHNFHPLFDLGGLVISAEGLSLAAYPLDYQLVQMRQRLHALSSRSFLPDERGLMASVTIARFRQQEGFWILFSSTCLAVLVNGKLIRLIYL